MLHALLIRAAAAALLTVTAVAASAQPVAKPRIEKAADLPRFSYKIDGKLEDIVRDGAKFAPFGAAVRRDTESVIAGHEIADRATLRGLVTQLAVMDFLDGQYDRALTRLDEVRDLEDKPADKLMSGLRLRAMALAAKANELNGEAYRKAVAEILTGELARMPFAVVANDARELKMSAELIGEALILGRVREVMQPIVDQSGMLSSDFAPGLIGARFRLLAQLPLKQTFIESFSNYLAANQVAKVDIWVARDVALKASEGRARVSIAVWDSGVDTVLFGPQVLRGKTGQPLVIAFDKFSRQATGVLMPIPPNLRSKLPQMTARTKGFSDLQSNIDSPEASEVKAFLSGLAPEKYKEAIEEIGLAGNYEHGTHVAGIMLAGNPLARLIVGRIEFQHTLTPDPCPSRETTLREARAAQATVDFFRRQGARVVNMSWGGDVKGIESQLEQCGIGTTPEARKTLAREYYDIGRRALTKAFAGAPGILFVTAAGNSGDDASFVEDIPASIVLPNLLTVGAVDLAGDEAGFTSYGPTVKVHANGYQVESVLPGGRRVALSGTSMAAPQVAGLAAKLLAVNPKLTPPQLIRIIVGTAERTADGRRNLMHPRKALVEARK